MRDEVAMNGIIRLCEKPYVQRNGAFVHEYIQTIMMTTSRNQKLFVLDERNQPFSYVHRFLASAYNQNSLVVFRIADLCIPKVSYVQYLHVTK